MLLFTWNSLVEVANHKATSNMDGEMVIIILHDPPFLQFVCSLTFALFFHCTVVHVAKTPIENK